MDIVQTYKNSISIAYVLIILSGVTMIILQYFNGIPWVMLGPILMGVVSIINSTKFIRDMEAINVSSVSDKIPKWPN